jgi:hypothetical protein
MLHLFLLVLIVGAVIIGTMALLERRETRRYKRERASRRRRHRAVQWAWDWLYARPSQKRLTHTPVEMQDRDVDGTDVRHGSDADRTAGR